MFFGLRWSAKIVSKLKLKTNKKYTNILKLIQNIDIIIIMYKNL